MADSPKHGSTRSLAIKPSSVGTQMAVVSDWGSSTKVSALTAPEGTGNGCAFSPDGRFLAVAHDTSPYITVYERSGTTFTKATALTAADGNGRGSAFSPDGRFLAAAHSTSPYITVYETGVSGRGSEFPTAMIVTAEWLEGEP